MSGLTFQTELAKVGVDLPVIFITGHGDIRMSVRAMKAGAVEFLTKPFHDQDLLDAIHAAIERDTERRREAVLVGELRERYATLTERERQIMTRVVTGRAKQADRRRARTERDDGEGSSRASHAEDAGWLLAQARAHGRPAGRAYHSVIGDRHTGAR